ncbi:MAG: hypothetical protein QM781_12535 [Chitinophagaceae bacterium]
MSQLLLIYDDNCPLCQWYTGVFVKTGLLPAGGRIPYSTISPQLQTRIDADKGRNQIPLIDLQTGQTWYGLDALLEVLGRRFHLIKRIGHLQPVYWFLTRLYRLISYNRKIVVASRCRQGSFDCAPDFNQRYRFLFLFITLLINTGLLAVVYNRLLQYLPGNTLSLAQVQTAHFLLVGINLTLACILRKERALEYLGQVTMLALIALLLQTPILLLSVFITPPAWLLVAYFGCSSLVVFREYLRRMDYAGLLTRHRWMAAFNLACMTAFLLFVFKA